MLVAALDTLLELVCLYYFYGGNFMTAKSYLICKVERFNDQESYLVPIQESFGDVYEGEAEIRIKLIHKNYHQSFNRYNCHHDFKHKKHGKAFNKYFTYYFEPIDFNMYYCSNSSLALVQTKTEISLDFIKQLNDKGYYKLLPTEINFKAMAPFITEMSGVWISNLKRTHVKTAGFFGPHVNRSEEFKEAAGEGEVSSIQMNYLSPFSGEEHTIGISQKGSVVLYDRFQTITDELDLIINIYETLINIKSPTN
jgi:hypothetical protein